MLRGKSQQKIKRKRVGRRNKRDWNTNNRPKKLTRSEKGKTTINLRRSKGLNRKIKREWGKRNTWLLDITEINKNK